MEQLHTVSYTLLYSQNPRPLGESTYGKLHFVVLLEQLHMVSYTLLYSQNPRPLGAATYGKLNFVIVVLTEPLS